MGYRCVLLKRVWRRPGRLVHCARLPTGTFLHLLHSSMVTNMLTIKINICAHTVLMDSIEFIYYYYITCSYIIIRVNLSSLVPITWIMSYRSAYPISATMLTKYIYGLFVVPKPVVKSGVETDQNLNRTFVKDARAKFGKLPKLNEKLSPHFVSILKLQLCLSN